MENGIKKPLPLVVEAQKVIIKKQNLPPTIKASQLAGFFSSRQRF
jgi:hypothetical protein